MSSRPPVRHPLRSPFRSERIERVWFCAVMGVLLAFLAEISLPALSYLSMPVANDAKSATLPVVTQKKAACCNNCGCSDSARSNGKCCCTARAIATPSKPDEAEPNAIVHPQFDCPCSQSPTVRFADSTTIKTISIASILRLNLENAPFVLATYQQLPDISTRPEIPPPKLILQIDRNLV